MSVVDRGRRPRFLNGLSIARPFAGTMEANRKVGLGAKLATANQNQIEIMTPP